VGEGLGCREWINECGSYADRRLEPVSITDRTAATVHADQDEAEDREDVSTVASRI